MMLMNMGSGQFKWNHLHEPLPVSFWIVLNVAQIKFDQVWHAFMVWTLVYCIEVMIDGVMIIILYNTQKSV